MNHILYILDIFICTCSFFLLYFFKIGSFIPKEEYFTLFWVYIFLWTSLSVYNKKIKHWLYSVYKDHFQSMLFSSAFTLFFLTMIVSLTELIIVSRLFILSIVVVPFTVELLAIGLIRKWVPSNRTVLKDEEKSTIYPDKATLKLQWLLGGFVLLVISSLIMVRIKSGSFGYYPWSEHIFLQVSLS